ncbi:MULTISPECIES: molybdopterin-binding protein [Clostridium]|uniref:Molybdopterin molybdenumtransferase n=1 Tax=Clostridium beijerinckii TaxID=1520 RepID=A0A1S9N5D5_CLOBE|nr:MULTISPECIES: molybdopterin-binding protein [Clostridium]MBN7572991.1 molybdopterin-binding protein [Clostridium beijerinckii]MBN7578207.1 molybdopterin-binding protein [Clostridium beijerinckii]MBN7582765.1 molybdopterin-binding protein [Clostridium beijerinckii]MBO0521684.1 molybdopterin-binding protein [Clostridium beijerinckii]OOP72729.1 molybdopterin-binding protein [Clostridium beijerinckii]
MKMIKTIEAVGHVLCHDITRIIKDVTKDIAFKKGHIIREEDVPILLSLGKDNIYIWEKSEDMLHENEAADILFNICKGKNISGSDVREGKVDLIADVDGLLRVDVDRLNMVNSLGEMMIATRHNNFSVKKGDKLAGTRIIPLIIEKEKMDEAIKIGRNEPLLNIIKFKRKKVGIVTTGNEVHYGRIKDSFGPVIIEKLSEYDVEILGQEIVNDDLRNIGKAINKFIEKGADMIVCTGGMSVDPDDLTPSAIKNTGAEIISYGAPVLPGAMFLLSYYKDNIPIIGLPGCVMYSKRTIFDLVLPRIMADIKLSSKDLALMGHGGLCLSCDICTYPNCGFGKGI